MFGIPNQKGHRDRCPSADEFRGAEGGNRTRTPLRTQDFKSHRVVSECFDPFGTLNDLDRSSAFSFERMALILIGLF